MENITRSLFSTLLGFLLIGNIFYSIFFSEVALSWQNTILFLVCGLALIFAKTELIGALKKFLTSNSNKKI